MSRSNAVLRLGDELAGPHQALAWREVVSPFWEFDIPKENTSDFRGRSDVVHLGNAILCVASASSLRIERRRSLVARMGVDHILAHVRTSGQARVAIADHEITCAPGDICLFDLSQPLTARSTDYQAITVVLPRRLFGAGPCDLDSLHGAVIRGTTPIGALINDHLRSLSAQAAGFSSHEAIAAAEATAILLGAGARAQSGTDRIIPTKMRAPLLIAIRRFIEGALMAPDLDAEHLCRRFGVSRSALYRLFTPMGGVTGYIRQRRLACAYRDLATGGDVHASRISEVAYRWRFESAASFAQAFRAEYGCAPRDIRAQALTGDRSSKSLATNWSPSGETWANFYDWVLRLTG